MMKKKQLIPGFKPAAPEIPLDADLINVLDTLDEKIVKDLTNKVIRGLKTDYVSLKKYLQDCDEWTKLAIQTVESKSTPWEKASNVKYPLVAMGAIQFQSLVYPVIVHGPNLVRCQVVGAKPSQEAFAAAHRIGLHMSWQLLEQMESWESDTDRLLIMIAIIGTMFRKVFFNPDLQRNDSCLLSPASLIVNYNAESLQKAPRATHLFKESRSDVVSKVRTGFYSNIEINQPSGMKHEEVSDTERAREERTGMVSPAEIDDTTPYAQAEQSLRYDLDGDGYAEPILVTVNLDSGTIMRVSMNYADRNVTRDTQGRVIRIEPKTIYVSYGFIPNPDSAVYSLGLGQLVGPLNNSINTVLNMLIDSGTLSNTQCGLLARGARLKKGQNLIAPGQFIQTDVPPDKLMNSIFPIPIKEPSNVLFQLLGLLIDVGHRLSNTTDPQTGENPGQNQAATTTLAVLEQGVKVFKSIYTRIHRSLKNEFKVLFELNADYLDAIEYFGVVQPDEVGAQDNAVARSDYQQFGLRVVPHSDPTRVSATARMIRQQARNELVPTGLINIQEHVRRGLEAMDEPDIDALMAPNPPQKDLKLQIEELRAQIKKYEIDQKTALGHRQVASEAVKDQGVAILALAKAESEVKNRDTQELQSQLDNLARLVDMAATGAASMPAQQMGTEAGPADEAVEDEPSTGESE